MAAAKIICTKSFTYRGATELWSTGYHLTDHPTDPAAWEGVARQLATWEQTCFTDDTIAWAFLGYENSDNPAVWGALATDISAAYSGSFAIGAGQAFAGDQAGTVACKTGLFSTKGKPIWLRKYFHDGVAKVDPDSDWITDDLATAYGYLFGLLLSTEIAPTVVGGGTPIYYADRNGRRPDGPIRVDPFVTTRTLERRGKRP